MWFILLLSPNNSYKGEMSDLCQNGCQLLSFQEVSPCRLNISFCSLQNVYLPSELPALNNSGRLLTKTC